MKARQFIFLFLPLLVGGCGYAGVTVLVLEMLGRGGSSGAGMNNTAPLAFNLTAADRVLQSQETLSVSLIDGQSDSLELTVEILESGMPARPVTLLHAPGRYAAHPEGNEVQLIWNVGQDFPNLDQLSRDVTIRVTPSDGGGTGASDEVALVVGNDPVQGVFLSPEGGAEVSGNVTLEFSLLDPRADRASIAIEYSLDGGSSWSSASIEVGATAFLETSPTGTIHTVSWNTVEDLGVSVVVDVQIRISPSDSGAGLALASSPFIVVNNAPPGIVLEGHGSRWSDSVEIVGRLTNPEASELVQVRVEWSDDDFTTSQPATMQVDGVGFIGLSHLLAASPSGVNHDFVWLAANDLGTGSHTGVKLRFVAIDSVFEQPAVESNLLVVGNDPPVLSFGAEPSGTRSDNVALEILVADSTADEVDLSFSYRFNSGPALPATIAGTTQALASTDGPGLSYTLAWQSGLDVGEEMGAVVLYVQGTDSFGATSLSDSTLFTLDNLTVNLTPGVQIQSINGRDGPIAVTYVLSNDSGETVEISVEFSLDGGQTFLPATAEGAGSDGTTGLLAGSHVFIWDSKSEPPVGEAGFPAVVLRITPEDAVGNTGPGDVSAAFTLGNDAPVATIQTPAPEPLTGNIPVLFTLFDSTADLTDILLEASLDGGAFIPATVVVGSVTALRTGFASPVAHDLAWDSEADFGDANGQVVLRLTPMDAIGEVGSPALSSSFDLINNFPPSVALEAHANRWPGDVTLVGRLTNPDVGESVRVFVAWSADGFQTSHAATMAVDGNPFSQPGQSPRLSASASGQAHVFLWHASTDLPPGAQGGVQLRFTVMDDEHIQSPVSSNLLVVGNDGPVVRFGAEPMGTRSDNVAVDLEVSDSTSDVVDLSFSFRFDAGPLQTASIAGSTSGLLSAPGSGASHSVVWQSGADVGIGQGSITLFVAGMDEYGTPGPSDSVSFTLDNLIANFTPSVQITGVSGRDGPITLVYDIGNDAGESVSVAVDYSLNGGASFQAVAAEGAGSDGTSGLFPGSHVFVWDSKLESAVGESGYPQAVLRLTPTDAVGKVGATDVSATFVLGNDVPVATVETPAPEPLSGNVPLAFTLFDSTSDLCSVLLEVSLNGAPFDTATVSVGQINNLVSSQVAPVTHDLAWDSEADVGISNGQVVLRLTPIDAVGEAGTARETAPFLLENNSPPGIALEAHATRWPGDVTIAGRLTNPEPSESVRVVVEWSDDGFVTSQPATMRVNGVPFPNPGSSQLLTASPSGVTHSFVWQAGTDLGPGSHGSVELRFAAVDGIHTQTPVLSNPLIVGNDAPAVSFGAEPTGTRNDNVALDLFVADSTSDAVGLSFSYRLDAGPLQAASIAGSTDGLLSAPGGGATHRLVWQSGADVGNAQGSVTIYAVPSDEYGAMGAADSAQFTLNNLLTNLTPSLQITGLSGRDGPIILSYNLSNDVGESVNVAVEYSLDNGVSFQAVTAEGPGSDGRSGLLAGSHVFVWSSKAESLVGEAGFPEALLRFTPTDAFGQTGPTDISNLFLLGNDAPVATLATPGPNPLSGNVPIDFTLFDSTADLCRVILEASLNGGAFDTASVVVGSLTGLRSSFAAPVPHDLAWSSEADFGHANGQVVLRLTPIDALGEAGSAVLTNTFELQNNFPPAIALEAHASRWPGDVSLVGRLTNPDAGESVRVYVEWSDDGFATAHAASMEVDGVPFPQVGQSPALLASASGIAYDFVWCAGVDLPQGAHENIQLRFTASDDEHTQDPVESNLLSVGNDGPTVGFGAEPTGTRSDNVTVDLVVADSSSDDVDLSFSYRLDAGPVQPANIAGSTSGLLSAPGTGASHSVVWQSGADVGTAQGSVTLYVVGTDAHGASGPADSVSFNIDNLISNFTPAVQITGLSGRDGPITLSYDLSNDAGESVFVVIEYSLDNGMSFQAVTAEGSGSDGTSGLFDGNHVFNWDSKLEGAVGEAGFPKAVLRLTPTDAVGKVGATDVSAVFVLGNDMPIATLQTPAPEPLSGNVPVAFTLFDSTSDLCSVLLEASLNGAPFDTATISVGRTTSLISSDTAAVAHDLAWDSEADFGLTNGQVLLRLTPIDSLGEMGASESTAVFQLTNNAPPSIALAAHARRWPDSVLIVGRLTNPEAAESVHVVVEWSDDDFASTQPASMEVDGTPFVGISSQLSASPSGIEHDFVWRVSADLAQGAHQGVKLRFSVRDAEHAQPFVVSNALDVGNDPPSLAFGAEPAGTREANVAIDVLVADNTSDPVDLGFSYRLDGGPLMAATITGSVVDLVSVPAPGFPHSVAWQSLVDVGPVQGQVTLYVQGSDIFGAVAADSVLFLIDNLDVDSLPAAVGLEVPERVLLDVETLRVVLVDGESDSLTLDLKLVELGGDTSSLTLVAPAASYPSLPGGRQIELIWNVLADFPDHATVSRDVSLAVTPNDGQAQDGTPAQTSLVVGNDPVSGNFVIPVAGDRVIGNVSVFFALSDLRDDPADVVLEYSSDGMATWHAATVVVGATTELETSPIGELHSVSWDSLTDLGVEIVDNVVLRIQPSDSAPGLPFVSGAFTVDNNTPPIAVLTEPSINTDERDAIVLEYQLVDQESDPCDVVLQWRREGSASYPDVSALEDPLVRRSVLADPEQRAALQILTRAEIPVRFPRESFFPIRSADWVKASGIEGLAVFSPHSRVRLIGRTLKLHMAKPRTRLASLADPQAIAFESESTAVYTVAGGNPGLWRFHLIDATASQIAVSGYGFADPSELVFLSADSLLVADRAQGDLVCVDLSTGVASVVAALGGAARPEGIARLGDGRVLFTQAGDGSPGSGRLSRLEILADSVRITTLCTALNTPKGLDVDRLRETAYIAEPGGIVAFDLMTRARSHVVAATQPARVRLSSDGRSLYYSRADNQLVEIELRDTDIAPLTVIAGLSGLSGLALRDHDELLIVESSAGNILGNTQRRVIAFQEPGWLQVDRPLVPISLPGDQLEICGGRNEAETARVSSPTGEFHTFVWDSRRDAATDLGINDVRIRVTPFQVGGRRGTSLESVLPKRVLGGQFPDAPELINGFGNVQHIAAADLDGDGDMDVITANHNGAQISILYQEEPGVFGASNQTMSSGAAPHQVLAVDLDADGDVDIVSRESQPFQLSLFLQTSPGVFSSPQPLSTGLGLADVYAADLDGDGDLDLVTADSGADQLSVFYQTSPGSFAAARTIATGASPQGVVAADIDGDGDLDLISADALANQLSIHDQVLPDSFLVTTTIPTGNEPRKVRAADIDGDGDLDLVSLDGLSEQLSIFLQTAFGFTSDQLLSTGADPRDFQIADLDDDGDLDFVCVDFVSKQLSIFYQRRTGGFERSQTLATAPSVSFSGGNPLAVAVADLDSDGHLDLATMRLSQIGIYFQTHSQPRPLSQTLTTGSSPRGVVAADLDGDGDLDLISADHNQDRVSVFYQTTPGSFSGVLAQGFPTGAGPTNLLAADIDGDGVLDLATADQDADQISVLYQTMPGSFDTVQTISTGAGSRPIAVRAADLNHDGLFDLAAANVYDTGSGVDGDIAVFFQTAPGSFANAYLLPTGRTPVSFTIADLNADGGLDVVSANEQGTEQLTIWYHTNSPGVFAGPFHLTGGAASNAVAAADMDGDRDLDLVSLDRVPGNHFSIYYQPGGFSNVQEIPAGLVPRDLAIADLDGDGHRDLITGQLAPASQLALFYQTSRGHFASAESIPGLEAVRVIAADLDGDGAVELVGVDTNTNQLHIFWNR